MKKKGCLLQKIKHNFAHYFKNTEAGQVEAAAGLFFLLFFAIFLCSLLQLDIYRASSQYLEDALAASNLASAVIDVEEYGITQNILISDPLLAFERYKHALKGNLNLDDNWQCSNKSLIAGEVTVADFIIYNCVQGQVYAYQVEKDGSLTLWQGSMGAVTAPNGIIVEATGIYSEVTFPVEGFLRIRTEATKGKLVDIVLNK